MQVHVQALAPGPALALALALAPALAPAPAPALAPAPAPALGQVSHCVATQAVAWSLSALLVLGPTLVRSVVQTAPPMLIES
jgi:hypothetical protein